MRNLAMRAAMLGGSSGGGAYTELEYINIGSNAYFDTGWFPLVTRDHIETEIRIPNFVSAFDTYFGCYDQNYFMLRRQSSSNAFQVYITPSNSCHGISTSGILGAWTFVKAGGINCNVGSFSYVFGSSSTQYTISCGVGSQHRINNGQESWLCPQSVFDCKYFKCFTDTVLSHNFIPVLKDNIPCFYDTVTEEYKYNIGTGDFTAGPIKT